MRVVKKAFENTLLLLRRLVDVDHLLLQQGIRISDGIDRSTFEIWNSRPRFVIHLEVRILPLRNPYLKVNTSVLYLSAK
mgnify:CR=1 FL=1